MQIKKIVAKIEEEKIKPAKKIHALPYFQLTN